MAPNPYIYPALVLSEDGAGFFVLERQEDNIPVKSAESTPTGKGNSVFLSSVQGRAASGFAENHPRYAPVFSAKTLHRRNTDLLKPVGVNPADSPSITIKIRIMNLNEAEIAVTTKRLATTDPKKSYRMELADYCDIDEFHHACSTWFPEETDPEYRYKDWENIPEYMVSSEWLCPNFFEVRDALERLDEFQQDSFEQWCGHYGYNLATEDPHLLVSYFQDSPHARMVVREEEDPEVEDDSLIYQGISSNYSFVTNYPYEVFDDNYD